MHILLRDFTVQGQSVGRQPLTQHTHFLTDLGVLLQRLKFATDFCTTCMLG
jgi:hypothetical protein